MSASPRRTFKPFDKAPRDGTPFNVAYIARYNRFAKTFEAAYRDQHSGEVTWEATPRVWLNRYYCDLLPLTFDLPKSFAVSFVATPVRPKTWRERLIDRLFGWLRVPDTVSLMQYCWAASAIEAASADKTENTGLAEGESAVAKPDAQTTQVRHD